MMLYKFYINSTSVVIIIIIIKSLIPRKFVKSRLNLTEKKQFNPLVPTLKLHSNVLLYSNMVIGTLAVDGWVVKFGTARRGLGGLGPRPVPSSLYQM